MTTTTKTQKREEKKIKLAKGILLAIGRVLELTSDVQKAASY